MNQLDDEKIYRNALAKILAFAVFIGIGIGCLIGYLITK